MKSVKCSVWSLECRVECEVKSMECGVRSVECRGWSVKFGAWSVQSKVWSLKYVVQSVEYKMQSVECKVHSVECRAYSAGCRKVIFHTERVCTKYCPCRAKKKNAHDVPYFPPNLHVVTTPRSPDIAICTKHATRQIPSAAPATQNTDGSLQSAASARHAMHVQKTTQKFCTCHTKQF